MRHLFLSTIEKRNIEENPGTPTLFKFFCKCVTLRQVLEKGDVKKTLVMCFPQGSSFGSDVNFGSVGGAGQAGGGAGDEPWISLYSSFLNAQVSRCR
jgi:hypothetical protein